MDFDLWLQRKVKVELNYAIVSLQNKRAAKENKPKVVNSSANSPGHGGYDDAGPLRLLCRET